MYFNKGNLTKMEQALNTRYPELTWHVSLGEYKQRLHFWAAARINGDSVSVRVYSAVIEHVLDLLWQHPDGTWHTSMLLSMLGELAGKEFGAIITREAELPEEDA